MSGTEVDPMQLFSGWVQRIPADRLPQLAELLSRLPGDLTLHITLHSKTKRQLDPLTQNQTVFVLKKMQTESDPWGTNDEPEEVAFLALLDRMEETHV